MGKKVALLQLCDYMPGSGLSGLLQFGYTQLNLTKIDLFLQRVVSTRTVDVYLTGSEVQILSDQPLGLESLERMCRNNVFIVFHTPLCNSSCKIPIE